MSRPQPESPELCQMFVNLWWMLVGLHPDQHWGLSEQTSAGGCELLEELGLADEKGRNI